MKTHDPSPTARALTALELLQDNPGITAQRLAEKLGVSDRAARRYVGILREAGMPIDSERGPYGGYRVGRGLRHRPLIFTSSEALGLVMAVLEGGHGAGDADDPVQTALGKILRVLPEPMARSADALRAVSARRRNPGESTPQPETTAFLVDAGAAGRRVRLHYRTRPTRESVMEVDPWAVVVRYGRWYLLCWSHSRDARRMLRVDRVARAELLDDTFTPPADLDPVRTIDEHLAQAWSHRVEVVIDAPLEQAEHWVPHQLGRLEAIDEGHTRLVGTTDEPEWYAGHLTAVEAAYRIVEPPIIREAARRLGERLLRAGT